MRTAILSILMLGVGAVPRAPAQTPTPTRPATADSVFARARQLVVNGNGAAGRVLVDSVVAATEPETPAYAEALYWRAALAAASSDAERDYRRIVIEYPLSPRASEALLQLAQIEVARGDRPAAASHLERFLLENPSSPDEQRAGVLLVRISFEQNDLPRGCIALHHVLTEVPATAVELRNQLEYYSPRCAGVDTTRARQTAAANPATPGSPAPATGAKPTPPGGASRDSAHRDSVHRDTTPPPHALGKFTLQVAAYTSRADADALAKRLKARGIDVRVAGTKALYRVRIGHYETRAAAAAAAAQLKTKKIVAFVTDVGTEDK
ncbi:MAG: SPOR domain-containing protein [bacterium]